MDNHYITSNKSAKVIFVIKLNILVLIIGLAIFLVTYFKRTDNNDNNDNFENDNNINEETDEITYKEDIDFDMKTVSVRLDTTSLSKIANEILRQYSQSFSKDDPNRFAISSIDKTIPVAGTIEEFAVSIEFRASPAVLENNQCYLGTVDKNGTVPCKVMLLIQKQDIVYVLKNIASKIYYSNLEPITNNIQRKDVTERLPIYEKNDYKMDRGVLYVTYDSGKTWMEVKANISKNEHELTRSFLPDGSYYISPSKTVIIDKMTAIISNDSGKTWNTYTVDNSIYARVAFVNFYNDSNGVIIAGTDKTMGQEIARIYKTYDGGITWKEFKMTEPKFTSLIIGGIFITEDIGFISYTPYDYFPIICRSINGGATWEKIKLQFPVEFEYQGIFTIAYAPTFNGANGTLIVAQGSDGDFEGGKKVARFISNDYGKTWTFDAIVTYEQEYE